LKFLKSIRDHLLSLSRLLQGLLCLRQGGACPLLLLGCLHGSGKRLACERFILLGQRELGTFLQSAYPAFGLIEFALG